MDRTATGDLRTVDFPAATPLTDAGVEPASRSITVVLAAEPSFVVAGATRTAFVVGPRTSPIAVHYVGEPSCREWTAPAWAAGALLGVGAEEVRGSVLDLDELPRSPVRDALAKGRSDLATLASRILAEWFAGPRPADSRLAIQAWRMIEAEPEAEATEIARAVGVGQRRLRQALQHGTGLSLTSIRRLVRLERAVAALGDQRRSLAHVAVAMGFADQSHMTREFTALAGVPPGRLRAALASRDGA